MKVEESSPKDLQYERKRHGNKVSRTRIEFRVPADDHWILDSMAKFYYENGYISKPNKSQVARLGLNLFAKNFMNQGGTLTQELKGIVPIRYYKKLVDELRETKEQLTELKEYASKCDKAIED